jgi:aerobic carbon-monoxide dehydrogenase medium subunit
MRSPPFEYARPQSVGEAIEFLGKYGDEAKVLAGGQSLIPLLSFRAARPTHVVDIGGLKTLDYITVVKGGLEIGALTPQRAVELSPDVRQLCPLLHEAIGHVGHRQTRNRGTIGGSLAHADPAAELPAVAVALRAELRVQGPRGTRAIAANDFFDGYLATALRADELLLSVLFPAWPSGSGSCFVEFCRRQGDFAIVGAAAIMALDADGTITRVGLALNGIGGRAFDGSDEVASLLTGKQPDEETFAVAAAKIEAAVKPDSDIHAPADYRRHLAKVMSFRALTGAAGRATPGRGEL